MRVLSMCRHAVKGSRDNFAAAGEIVSGGGRLNAGGGRSLWGKKVDDDIPRLRSQVQFQV